MRVDLFAGARDVQSLEGQNKELELCAKGVGKPVKASEEGSDLDKEGTFSWSILARREVRQEEAILLYPPSTDLREPDRH